MNEIISKWILNRINYMVDMTPEIFRVKTANGRLISKILQSYGIITNEDVNSLKKTDHVSDCNKNFKLINCWLNDLNLNLSEEDIYDIVHGIGSASLHLFYTVLIELKDNDEELICAQLCQRLRKYRVKPSEEVKLQMNGDHDSLNIAEVNEELNDLDNRTYEELINLQKEANGIAEFVPDPKKVKQILNNLHVKNRMRQENRRNKLNKNIKNYKNEDENSIKQFLQEKQLETRMEKENKKEQDEILNIQMREKQFVDALLLKDETINQQKLLYYLERERVQQLHKKIWNKKVKLNQQTIQQICNEALKDIVEISIKISEYKKRYKQKPNELQMENLNKQFLSGGFINEICAPKLDDITDNKCDIPEEIITIDINKQSKIDEEEIENYRNNRGVWKVENLANFSLDTIEQINCGLDVLGYIVHQALEHKYPIVTLWETAHIPNVPTRVCINGLTDTSILPSLRNLLAEKEIKIIELKEAVDYCLKAFKQESKRELEEKDNVSLTKELKAIKKVPDKLKKKEKASNKKLADLSATPLETENKQVQTPLKFPCEEIIHTHHALLGKTAQELLDQGKPIGDFLLADMFIEYLRSIPDLKGWALVNYPTNFEQAVIIEEALTGLKLMNIITGKAYENEINLIENSAQDGDKDVCSLFGECDVKRHSKILKNPITPKPVQTYDTALTAFIRLKQISADGSISFEINDQMDDLDKFYFDVGANYPLYYKELDWDTVKRLARLIIGDYSLPLKSSVELFGTNQYASNAMKTTKKSQTKQDKTSGTKMENVKVKKGKTIVSFEDKCVQVPSEDEDKYESSSVIFDVPEPGQSGWEYSQSTCPEEILNSSAIAWETVEEIYTNDLKQVLYLIRLNLNSVVPFLQYVKDRVKQIPDRPDQQSAMLSKLRSAFNAFDMDARKSEEFKVEMYCRIEDFKEKLAEMSDLQMMESEDMRMGIISSNWATDQVKEIINNYISILQIELLRFIESVHFINDYYTGTLSGSTTNEDLYRTEIILKFDEIGSDYINKMFQDGLTTYDIVYFEELLSNVIDEMRNSIEQMNENVASCIKVSEADAKETGKTSKNSIKSDLPLINEESAKFIKEWQKAAKGEALRINLQIELVKSRALESINQFLKPIQKMFHEISNEIQTKYFNEMQNITQIYHIFNAAVANETAIRKELIFEVDFNTKVDEIVLELPQEIIVEEGFGIDQLSKLSDIFLNLSPSGYMTKANFLFILQDVIAIENASFPNVWNKLVGVSMLKKVVDRLFDDLPYVYWKDFIVYNLPIPFPSEREFLITRKNLRKFDPFSTELIQEYDFFSINLWFEYVYLANDSQRNMDVKKLLYKLYYIKNRGFNYTAMLLDFCKDPDTVKGFAKALALSLGKLVCWDFNVGNNFKDIYLNKMREHEDEVERRNKELEILYKEVYEEIGKLADKIVDDLEGLVIEDYSSDHEEVTKECPTTPSNTRNKNSLNLPENVRTDNIDSTGLIHFLPLEAIITVLSALVPWHLKIDEIGDSHFCEKAAEIYENCKNPDFNMSVLSHEYLNDEMFRDLLGLTKKFRAIDPLRVVIDVLDGQ